MLLNPLTYHTPKTISEAIHLYSSLDNVKLQAGGTFLLNNLKLLKRKGIKTPDHVVSLRKVEELKGVSEEKGFVVIKAMTTITDILDSLILTGNMDILKTAAKNVSTCAIRNMATVGGNLTCRYTWTEMPAVMVGLGADLHFIGFDGQKEVVAAEEFYQNGAKTDKLFTHVTIKKDPEASMAYRRVKKTPHVDIPLLSMLIRTNFVKNKFTNTRVSINNCVGFAQRDRTLESFLDQSERREKIAEEALDHLSEPIYDIRSSDYKKHMFRISIRDALKELVTRT